MKKLKSFALSAGIAALVVLGSCEDPKPVPYKAKDLCSKTKKDDLIVTEGTLAIPSSFYSNVNYGQVVLEEARGGNGPAFYIFYGADRKNAMERLPAEYGPEDVKLYDENGEIIKLGEKVRFTASKSTYCQFYVSKVERVK